MGKTNLLSRWQDNPLSIANSKAVQGVCAVLIILHHLSQNLTESTFLSCFEEIGVLMVGVFFFFSGYGLFTSLKTKDNYLKGFFRKRLPKILVPFYTVTIVFFITSLKAGEHYDLRRIIEVFTGWRFINDHMWYIIEILILYIIFYIVFRLIKQDIPAIILMTVITAAIVVWSLRLGHGEDYSCKYWFMGEWWYNTTMMFIVGIWVAKFARPLAAFARKFYYVLLPVMVVLTVVFYRLTHWALEEYSYWMEYPGYMGYKEKYICLSLQLPMVIFFVLAVVLIMMKVNFNNFIMRFLGMISLELYLIHNLIRLNLRNGVYADITNDVWYVLLTVILSIGSAVVLHMIDVKIMSLFNKKKVKKS